MALPFHRHVGSLLQIMLLRHFQKCGHKPIVLVGGGTTKVGDPSGKDASRQLLTQEIIDQNIEGISQAIATRLHYATAIFSHPSLARIIRPVALRHNPRPVLSRRFITTTHPSTVHEPPFLMSKHISPTFLTLHPSSQLTPPPGPSLHPICAQVFSKFLKFGDGPTDAVLINNDEWLSSLEYLPFLREYGRHFTINRMLSFESVKQAGTPPS